MTKIIILNSKQFLIPSQIIIKWKITAFEFYCQLSLQSINSINFQFFSKALFYFRRQGLSM